MRQDGNKVETVLAYVNKYGRIISVVDYENLKNNPKTAWVIEGHWKDVFPLGRMYMLTDVVL